jgi:hypothetical protein
MTKSQELSNVVLKAQEMVSKRLKEVPNYGVYIHARDQLEGISAVLKQGAIPNSEQKKQIDIALMAVKELESTEPELADVLCMVDYIYKKLA